jgi:hypothetical protein
MTILQVDLATLVKTSELVLEGQIGGARVVDRRKEGRSVWTEYTLEVAEVWKGDAKLAGRKFSWRQLGGSTTDGMTVAVPGMPRFAVGEEVVLLLERTREGHTLAGGPQGRWLVRKGPDGRKMATRELGEAHVVRPDAQGKLADGHAEAPLVRHLPDLREEVKRYVREQAAAAQPAPAVPPAAGGAATVQPAAGKIVKPVTPVKTKPAKTN